MTRRNLPVQRVNSGIKPTSLEEGLRSAILADEKGRKALENLTARGYHPDSLIIHLTLWARSPRILFDNSAKGELPSREKKRKLERLVKRLRLVAAELDGYKLFREQLRPQSLRVNQFILANGGPEMARCIELLPKTLNVYSFLLKRSLLITSRFARTEKTLNQHRAEFTRIFFDSVKITTERDRIDSVVQLFNLASQHFKLGEHFEKRALTAQLSRIRDKIPTRLESLGSSNGI